MLAVNDLAVRFGGVTALERVSFEVRPGSITSVIGPNGAGKTTAFNAITGYLRPTGGRVTYDGAALTGLRPSAIARRGIVRTFQKTSVFPALSVEDNVVTGLHLRSTAGFLAVLAGRRRLAAEERSLAAEAADIIEFVGLKPGAGMTGAEKVVVSGLIRRVREQGVTVLLVEHDMRMVMGISDTVIVLNGGRVIAEGAPAAIRAHPEVIRAYLGASAGSS